MLRFTRYYMSDKSLVFLCKEVCMAIKFEDSTTVLERMQDFVRTVSKGEHESIKPGQPVRFTEACVPGDRIWQGDLALTIRKSVPQEGYVFVKEAGVQLVIGNTEGAKHCLDSMDGVKFYAPVGWGEESIKGPILVLSQERTVLHPVHGNVTVPAGFIVECTYQREWDKEQAREARARD